MPVRLIRPHRFGDESGWFQETYNAATYPALGVAAAFEQDNHSMSREKGVLRGLHWQAPPHGQDKLVRSACGARFGTLPSTNGPVRRRSGSGSQPN